MNHEVHYPEAWSRWQVALSHDWLTGMRGGEKVLELLGAGFPQAHLYCLLYKPGSVSETIANRPIHTSWLQRVPGIHKTYRYFLPLFPLAIRTAGRPRADLLISTSHCAAKALPHHPETRHLCYCFTPMRYAWTFHEEYFGASTTKRLLLAPTLAGLRRWDRAQAKGVDRFVAISHHVRRRIETFYGRDADVVYPPANTDYYTPDPHVPREDVDVVVSALVPYKRVDLAVRAYTRSGRRLVVIGAGTEFEKLQSLAGPSVSLLGWQPDDVIRDWYRRCRFLVFPGEEDFGIVPVEAMACGTPVIAYRKGGATETVREGVSGCFFDHQAEDALNDARADAEASSWSEAAIREQAERYSRQRFIDEMAEAITRCRQH
ncbi:MAG TPA: glycosyltransferase [Kiritimatiellia bacterium]|nr:glycosyltransferase [Kiritimatiellia bacterium]HMO98956.1 glycosyltransferase [Kiritimatiellia bacterium]HMP95712.1 glycosyltransferase [Kiritimatiellia bacterium]